MPKPGETYRILDASQRVSKTLVFETLAKCVPIREVGHGIRGPAILDRPAVTPRDGRVPKDDRTT